MGVCDLRSCSPKLGGWDGGEGIADTFMFMFCFGENRFLAEKWKNVPLLKAENFLVL
jgi:hypothetical protein